MRTKVLLVSILLGVLFFSCDDNEQTNKKNLKEFYFTGEVGGCSDFMVYQFLSEKKNTITLSIDGKGREELGLNSEYKKFSVPSDNISIVVTEWEKPAHSDFCNDVISDNKKLKSWKGVSGNLKIKISDVEKTKFSTHYKITIIVENVVFKNEEGQEKIISKLIIKDTMVGWLPG